jgi:hypothetical protein
MSWPYGNDYEYANSRLAGTILCPNGRPVYVKEVCPDGVYVRDFISGECLKLEYDQMDVTPPELGFFIIGEELFHLSRMPVRRYKQGLTYDNTYYKYLGGVAKRAEVELIRDALLSRANGRVSSQNITLIGPEWATYKGILYYKDLIKVGKHSDGFHLLEKYSYLKECLDEACEKYLPDSTENVD